MGDAARLVPVPPMSSAGFSVYSEIRASAYPARSLYSASRAGRIPPGDLPEVIARIWTEHDSATSDVSEDEWIKTFRSATFFTYPPLVTKQPDGSRVSLARPGAAVTLYRGSTPARKHRMSWAYDPAMAELLGRRHARYGAAAVYKATCAPEAILAYLERRGEGWTIVVDPAGLTDIQQLTDIANSRQDTPVQ